MREVDFEAPLWVTDGGILIPVGAPIEKLQPAELPSRQLMVRAALVCGVMWLLSDAAAALIVGATPGVLPNTATAPASDPGFANVARTGTNMNAVYLGDGWMLSARHTQVGTVKFDHLPDPISAVPNQFYIVPNPTGSGLTPETDLVVYRIKDDPDLPSLAIASQPPTPNNQPGAELMMISIGRTRDPAEKHFQVNTFADPWTWTATTSGGNYRGYDLGDNGIATKRWGKNHVADENPITSETDANLTSAINTGRGHVISYFTTYDWNGSPYESQAIGGDSGSPLFYNRSGQWELTGIVHSNYLYSGQTSATFNPSNALAIYGNATAIADLSSYRNQILAITSGHPNYSIMGDVNLDGVRSGDGTGNPATDDIAAFIAGWKFEPHLPTGNLTSWKKGDLNRDGRTDVADFILLRAAFNGQSQGSAVLSMFASVVPEPTTAGLAFLGLATLLGRRHRRRSR